MAGQLGHIAATAELNVNPFIQSTKVLERSIKTTSQAMRAQEVAYKNSGNSLNSLTASHQMAGRQLNQYDALLKKQNAEYTVMKNKIGDVNNATDKEKQMLANKATQINKTTAQMEGLRGKYSSMSKTIATQNSLWTKSGNVISSAGEKMTKASGSMRTFSTVGAVGLGVAVNSALKFDNEIKSMGALLGTTGSTLKNQLAGISEASKKWSVEYGVSTSAINEGMSELIKKGYTYNQAMGAMPSILDATSASGDDFNNVMSVSTSVLEQFGLKSNNTNQMLKNTQRVTDSLTFVANETAAGFGDMGLAMEYVGPVANGLDMSLESTAAAIGLMSNRGIEGEKAGTALRGALSKLMKPSKQNAEGFNKLGISVKDFKNGTLDLPTILDKVNQNTKGMTKQQKASTVAMAFGVEAQTGMNAMLAAGGNELRKLTKETQNAKGYTKSLAETMNDTAQANVKKFKESLNVLGIEVGAKLVPKLIPLIDKLKGAVDWFSKLDDKTLQTVVTVGALTVALGPALGILGKTASGVGFVAKGFGKLSGVLNSTKLVSTATGFKGVESAAAGVGSKVGLLPGLFTPAGLAIAGVTVAAVAGTAAWELWGKKAYESSSRTSTWGSDVGKTADTALSKYKDFSAGATTAIDTFDKNNSQSAADVSKAFSNMATSIKNDAKSAAEAVTGSTKGMPDVYKENIEKIKAILEEDNKNQAEKAKSGAEEVKKIVTRASDEKRNLSSDEKQKLLEIQQQMNTAESKLWASNAKDQKNIEKALNLDLQGMSEDNMEKTQETLVKQLGKQRKAYQEQADGYKNIMDKEPTSSKAYKQAEKDLSDLTSAFKSTQSKLGESIVDLGIKSGQAKGNIIMTLRAAGYSYEQAAQIYESSTKSISQNSKKASEDIGGMAKSSKNASQAEKDAVGSWNSLVWDDKKAAIKTNVQEEVTAAAKDNDKWNNMMYLAKKGDLKTNAKEEVAIAAIQSGRWNEMDWTEKEAVIKDKATVPIIKSLEQSGVWNKMDVKAKEAIINSKGGKELVKTMVDTKMWDSISVDEKEAIIKTTGNGEIYSALKNTKAWNALSPKEQQAVVTSKGGKDLVAVLMQKKLWNAITPAEQQAVMKTTGGAALYNILQDTGKWNGMTPKEQQAVANVKGAGDVYKIVTQLGLWNQLPLPEKKLLASNKDVLVKLVEAGIKIDDYNLKATPNIQKLKGENGQVIGVIDTATGKITTYNKKELNKKELEANGIDVDNKTKKATKKLDMFNTMHIETKKLNTEDKTSNKVNVADANLHVFDRNNPKNKNLNSSDNTSSKAKYAGLNLSNFNRNNPRGKSLKASDNASYNANKATGSVSAFQRKRDHTVTLTTKHTSIFTTISNYIKKHFERGTNSAPGGSAMVNDASGSNYQEMIQLPNGQRIMPQGRNVTMGIPKGSRVFTATQTKNMLRNVENSGAGSTLRQFNDVRQKETTATASVDLSGLNNQIEKLTKIMKQGMSNQKDGDVVINMNANIDGEQDIKQISKSLGFAIQRERRGSM